MIKRVSLYLTILITTKEASCNTVPTFPSQCFTQAQLFGNQTGIQKNDIKILNSIKSITPKHRITRISYCSTRTSPLQRDFNSYLSGLSVTVGIQGTKSTQTPLNIFGMLTGQCDSILFEKNETLTSIELIFGSNNNLVGVQILTNKGFSKLVGMRQQNSTNFTTLFKPDLPLSGFYGTFTSNKLTSLGFVLYKAAECDPIPILKSSDNDQLQTWVILISVILPIIFLILVIVSTVYLVRRQIFINKKKLLELQDLQDYHFQDSKQLPSHNNLDQVDNSQLQKILSESQSKLLLQDETLKLQLGWIQEMQSAATNAYQGQVQSSSILQLQNDDIQKSSQRTLRANKQNNVDDQSFEQDQNNCFQQTQDAADTSVNGLIHKQPSSDIEDIYQLQKKRNKIMKSLGLEQQPSSISLEELTKIENEVNEELNAKAREAEKLYKQYEEECLQAEELKRSIELEENAFNEIINETALEYIYDVQQNPQQRVYFQEEVEKYENQRQELELQKQLILKSSDSIQKSQLLKQIEFNLQLTNRMIFEAKLLRRHQFDLSPTKLSSQMHTPERKRSIIPDDVSADKFDASQSTPRRTTTPLDHTKLKFEFKQLAERLAGQSLQIDTDDKLNEQSLRNDSIYSFRKNSLPDSDIHENSITASEKKNYLKSMYLDDQWIKMLKDRNAKKYQELKELEKLKIAAQMKNKFYVPQTQNTPLALKLVYGIGKKTQMEFYNSIRTQTVQSAAIYSNRKDQNARYESGLNQYVDEKNSPSLQYSSINNRTSDVIGQQTVNRTKLHEPSVDLGDAQQNNVLGTERNQEKNNIYSFKSLP